VVHHTYDSRSLLLAPADVEDLAADVFVAILADDMAALRRFRGHSSLATYLTVIARRVVVRELLRRRNETPLADAADVEDVADQNGHAVEERLSNREHVQQMLDELQGPEADVIRLYHLEGKSYDEISQQVGIPANSIGPTLSRARAKLRSYGTDSAATS
jgi:RNA polymerase sigma-70 factor (ECF subfamily)